MATSKFQVEKFTVENDFHLWCLKMRALLVHQGLEETLGDPRSEKKPSKLSGEEMQDALDKAHSTLILSLGDGVLREVGDQTTAAGLWKKLEDLYTKKSLTKRLCTKKRLYTLQMEEGSSLANHIDNFNRIILDLEDINVKLEDEDKAIILLSSLPPSYEHFVDRLLYGRQSITKADVKDYLSSKEVTRKSEVRDGEGLTARSRSDKKDYSNKNRKRSKSKSKNKNLKCFQCQKEGHFKKDCPERKNKEKDGPKKNGNAAVASEEKDDEGYDSAGVRLVTGTQTNVMMGNNSLCKVVGLGTIRLKMFDGVIRELSEIIRGSMVIMKGDKNNGLYVLQGIAITGDVSVPTSKNPNKTLIWHMRLGHMSERGMKILEKQGVLGDDKVGSVEFCEVCVLGKSSRTSFKTAVHKTKGTLDYIHSDLWGPAQTISLGGAKYFLSLIDDYSRMVWVYLLKSKNKVFEKFKQWKALVETQTGRKVKRLRIDNGLEFCNQQFNDFCAQNGVVRHKTVRHTPQQNGLAERMNRTLMDKVRCLLIHSKLSQSLWAETLMIACYLVNRSPSNGIDFKTPVEMWSGRAANYSDLKIFVCPAFAHIKQGKLEPRTLKCVFLEYPEGVKGYRLWCTDLKPPRCIIKVELTRKTGDATSYETSEDEERDAEDFDEVSEKQTTLHDYQLARDRERREIRAPKKYAYADLIAYALTAAHELDYDEPKTYKEAISGKNADQWLKAMKKEMDSLYKNNTWTLVEKPDKKKVVGCKWVYKLKQGITRVEPVRFKARLVAKGFTQKEGIDFTEVFSPVVRHASIRIILSLVAVNNMHLEQMDVKIAFLHGELQEYIVMAQPEGFTVKSKADWVCHLKKSLYGLKQSPRQWYLRFDSFMLEQKYQRCNLDCCVYFREDSGIMIYLVLYVDDMLIASVSMSLIKDLKQKLKGEFDMKDLGPAKKILGMQLHRDRKTGTLFLSQEDYIRRVIDKFGMANSKLVQTPLAPHFRLSDQLSPTTEAEKSEMVNVPYASAVGCLMYAMVLTRLDLSYAVSVVSRYMANPRKEHWRAVKWILRYLNRTTTYGLMYGGSRQDDSQIVGYVDSDYAGDLDIRRSLTGYLFTLNNSTVNWKAQLQSVVALSTTEAEYTAAAEAVKEAIWLKGMLKELGIDQRSIMIKCDSQSAICLSKNQTHYERTKHIDIKLHFIRLEVLKATVKLQKIHTDKNVADMLTKPVTTAKFKLCLELAGICQKGVTDS
ncbi:Integrase catalytic domain-containing protein [Citrus sinensis]|nr:Integrase catalytic domain-containing protein [Citrus sinensis]